MNDATRIRFGPFELRTDRRELWKRGERCRLGGRAFDILLTLLECRHRVVGRDELLERVWPSLAVEPNNLQVQVCALRKVLGAHAIVTIARRGYRYAGPPPTGDAPLLAGGPPAAARPLPVAAGAAAGLSARRHLRWQPRQP